MLGEILRKSAIAVSVAVMTLSAGAPAFAGGFQGNFRYHVGYGGHGNYGYGHHQYRARQHHTHGGGKAAAIVLGVIGGAIIMNELAEENARQRAYERAYEERYVRYDPYARRAAPLPERYETPRYDEDFGAGDLGPQNGNLGEDAIERQLDGGPEPIRISVAAAYETCTRHARRALSARGFVLAAPAYPETAEDLGDTWKMTATVLAEDRDGGSWSRAMYCEADEGRVYLLELI